MKAHPEQIPQYILTFFREVDDYIDVLPAEFRLKLTDYMHLVAWQMTQDLSDGLPDEHFHLIKGRFQEAKHTVLN
jgi:hypothetical protein